jgi:PKD repeat protein
MKSITIFLSFFLLAGLTAVNAQSSGEPCGSTAVHTKRLETDTVYHRSWFNMEQRLHAMQQVESERSDEIFTIPVVVHIIHTGQSIGMGANISDEQINSAITALNEDFRKLEGSNGDGDGVDVGVEFCLASRDPNGNPTTGINRVNGSSVPLYETQGIKATGILGANEVAVKTLSVWPRASYLNIWVVTEIEDNNAVNGIQGYAYFPVNNVVDGIVILYNAFGTIGNVKPNTAMNRTLTHEVGHYVGLYHTFHSTTSCGAEVSCTTQGDKVCDTPPTVTAGSCNSPACSGTQQVENYMDYTAEWCRNMFSEGQKTRMRNTLLTQRATILESLGCMAVTAIDAGIASINQPTGIFCNGSISPSVRLTNYGSTTLNTCTINFSVDNMSTSSFNWTGSLAAAQSINVPLPALNTSAGEHEFAAWTSNPNGNADENSANNEATSNFTVSSGATLTLNITVDFFGSETTWAIVQNGSVLFNGGPYVNNQQGTTFSESLCLDTGCYTIEIYDSYGDGMSFTNGNYQLVNSDGLVLANGGGNFGLMAQHPFCVDAPEVVLPNPPVAAFSASAVAACGNLTTNFSNTTTGAPTSFTWSFPGGNPSSFTGQNPPAITYSSPGTYTVTLTASNEGGSHTASQAQFITVHANPTVSISSTQPTCNGQTNGVLQATAAGNGPFNYTWSNGATGGQLQNLGAGNYSVTAVGANNCSATSQATLINPSAINLTLFKSDITCFGAANGSISATGAGGTAPLLYTWSNGMTGQFVSGLTAGSYTATLNDANGCSTQASVQIAQPSEIVLSLTESNPETCAGNDGSILVNAMGGTGNLAITWNNGLTGQQLTNLNEGLYVATVTDGQGCTKQLTVDLMLECESAPESTKLIDEQCGAASMALSDVLFCNEVAGAEMYQWQFFNPTTGFEAEGFSLGNNNTFLLENVTNLAYGMNVSVKLRVQYAGNTWSPWGEACSISMRPDVPETELSTADCAAQTVWPGSTITANISAGAHTYQWAFDDGVNTHVFETYQSNLMLPYGEPLIEGQTYLVSVRVQVGDMWSSWGNACELKFGEAASVSERPEDAMSMACWPNPSTGENIFIQFRNLPIGTSVLELEVYDLSGKLVENKLLSSEAPQGVLTVHFDRKLQSGMYFLRTHASGVVFEEKIIVQ